jgi:hypothetical protein
MEHAEIAFKDFGEHFLAAKEVGETARLHPVRASKSAIDLPSKPCSQNR